MTSRISGAFPRVRRQGKAAVCNVKSNSLQTHKVVTTTSAPALGQNHDEERLNLRLVLRMKSYRDRSYLIPRDV